MLEALFQHFQSYGMDDLEFIIVNSKLSHSQEKLQELSKRVSFPVYQESEEEEVWSILDGGKDDMYIYDRCGRLTYFVPFPLSILNESQLVSNAVLSTYYRNVCGEGCVDQNSTTPFNFDNTTTEVPYVDYGITEDPTIGNEMIIDPSSNDLLSIIAPQNHSNNNMITPDSLNRTEDITETDGMSYNETNTHVINTTNVERTSEATGYFERLFNMLFNRGNNNSNTARSITEKNNNTFVDAVTIATEVQNDTLIEKNTTHQHKYHGHVRKPAKNIKSDRCVEADFAVCENWSKKRLLHAQRCCRDGQTSQLQCHHFGKRRCKKIQSILKCCIQTLYTDETTTSKDERNDTISKNVNNGTECCKQTARGKYCRFVMSGECSDDETSVAKSPDCGQVP